jgi:hypothetical protein
VADIWIVLIQDRHTDVDARPFSTEEAAVAAAWKAARANSWHPGDVAEEELNDAMIRGGWVLLLVYGTEGDRVRVMRRQVHG